MSDGKTYTIPVTIQGLGCVTDDPAPNRYSHGDIECIDAIRAALSPEEFRGFCKGNVIKYVWREQFKGGDVDIKKARAYIRYLLEGGADGEES